MPSSRSARDNLEAALEKYTDLYDFAPIGYLAIDEQGLILEVNLAAASMLEVERSRSIQRRWQSFVAPASRSILSGFLKEFRRAWKSDSARCPCFKEGGAPFWADLQARSRGFPRS